jgi:hypothetical protein
MRKIPGELVPQVFSEEQKQQWVEFWSKFCCHLAEGYYFMGIVIRVKEKS